MSYFKSFIMTIGAKPKEGWVKWLHFSVPDDEGSDRDKARKKLELLNHCKICTGLSGCFSPASNMPLHPQHPNCDCVLLSIATPVDNAEAYCAIEKFTGYIFAGLEKSKGKNILFERLGFTIGDSEYLKEEFERQAKEKYLSGDYTLGNLDVYGQRITISIELQSQIKNDIIIKTGWMIHTLGLTRQFQIRTRFNGVFALLFARRSLVVRLCTTSFAPRANQSQMRSLKCEAILSDRFRN